MISEHFLSEREMSLCSRKTSVLRPGVGVEGLSRRAMGLVVYKVFIMSLNVMFYIYVCRTDWSI